jgi:hypothetical protein
VFVIVPVRVGRTTIDTVAVDPTGSAAMVPPASAHVPSVVVTEMSRTPVGSVSMSSMRVALTGPPLATATL